MSTARPDADALAASYARCRELNRQHGTTYYWSAYTLPRASRPHVWALYAFCRYADDIVDDLGDVPVAERAAALTAFGDRFFADVATGWSTDPILAAVVDTVTVYGHDLGCFHRFLRSMAMDLTIATYDTWDDLVDYMDGSAAVIGEMMLPILGPDDPAAALGPARDLGFAFQLTNFLRDVGEDLERGRVYIPQKDLARFGADPTRRVADEAWVRLMQFECSRAWGLYVSAADGIPLLPPASARCVRTALVLYSGIITAIEDADYDVFRQRARVPTWRKLATVARANLGR